MAEQRKLVLFMHISLDGYACDKAGGLSWIPYNEEMEKYAESVVATVGSPVYGRNTYELMAGYWPTVLDNPDESQHSLEHARWIQDVEKIVISSTMTEATWRNTTLINGHLLEAMISLKAKPGKDLVIFGSPGAAKSLLKLGLIDELRLTICPVILGEGKTIFEADSQRHPLKLIETRALASGVIAAHYQVLKV